MAMQQAGASSICCISNHAARLSNGSSAVGGDSCKPAPVLSFMAQRLFLFSFILSDDAMMLAHFLRHYIGLGVSPMHVGLAVRVREGSDPASLQATLSTLRAAAVPRKHVRVIRHPPSDTLKLQLVNEHLLSLPSDAWAIYADVDELFDYPCDLRRHVNGNAGKTNTAVRAGRSYEPARRSVAHGSPTRGATFTAFRTQACMTGTMCDQMAANGDMAVLQPWPDVAQQYPLACRVRQRVFQNHMVYYKTVLHRVRPGRERGDLRPVLFRTTHALNSTAACAKGGRVRHYTMTAATMAGNREKAELERRSVNGVATNYANASCSFPYGGKRHKLICSDYSKLYEMQVEHVKNAQSAARSGVQVRPPSFICPSCPGKSGRHGCKTVLEPAGWCS